MGLIEIPRKSWNEVEATRWWKECCWGELDDDQDCQARDANISRLQLVVKLDYKNLSLDCKLIKYKLAFVVCLWPWSVLAHYKVELKYRVSHKKRYLKSEFFLQR